MGEMTGVPTEDGGMEFSFDNQEDALPEAPMGDHDENLVDHLTDDQLFEIANKVVDEFEADKQSRAEWESMFERGIQLLGLKIEETSEPFDGACMAVHPLLIENCVKFQSKASTELFPPGGPVKTEIIGTVNEPKEQKALRVRQFMNWQCTEQMPEYFDESERMLFFLAFFGSAFKKLYYHSGLQRPTVEMVPISEFYVSNFAKDLSTADRYTQVIYRTEAQFEQDVVGGLYKDIDIGMPTAPQLSALTQATSKVQGISTTLSANDKVFTLLEQHRYLAMPWDAPDGPLCPYVVTVDQESRKVLSVRRLWWPDDPLKKKIVFYTHYRYVPAFGFYGLGLIHFLGNLAMSATHSMRAFLDSAQFANMQGGIKTRALRFTDDEAVGPGQFKEAEFDGDDIRKAVMLYPFKEPSQGLLAMYQEIVRAGQKFADTTEQVVADSTNYGPVGTTLALLDASTKFFSAVHKRLHKAQKEEFRLLAELDKYWLPPEYPYDVVGGSRKVFKQDFDGSVDVVPVSDPNTPSQAHRIAKANAVYELAKQEPPGTLNRAAVLKYILTAADVPNVDNFVVDPDAGAEPRDPMSDIKAALQGIPVRAFPGQDHDAYIQVFTAFVQDPNIGQNPTFGPTIAVLTAAIRDHQVAQWMMQVESVMKQKAQQGQPQGRPPQIPDQIMAQAAQEVKSANEMRAQMPGGQINPDLLLAQSAMLDSQIKQAKLPADQVAKAAQIATRNRELDIRQQENMIEMVQHHMALTKDVNKDVLNQNTKLSIESSKRLMESAKLQSQERIARMKPKPTGGK